MNDSNRDRAIERMHAAEQRAERAEAALTPPTGTRLVLVADSLLDMFGTRTERGDRITAEWGEPSPEGWYSPTFTAHYDDNLVQQERERIAAAVKRVRPMQGDYIIEAMDGTKRTPRTPADWVEAYRAAVLAAIRPVEGEGENPNAE